MNLPILLPDNIGMTDDDLEKFVRYIVLVRRPDPDHEGPRGVETLLVDLRHHDVLQLVHHLVEALLAVRAWYSPSKILTKGIVEIEVKLLGK